MFSELTPLEVVTSRETTALLGGANLSVYVAFPPPLRDRAAQVIGRLRDAQIRVGAWPLLDDRDGRWANVWNGRRFADYTRRLLDELDAADLLPDELLLDLEPPIDGVKRVLRGRPPRRRRPADPGGRRALIDLSRDAAALCPVVATVAPFLCGPGGAGWQRALGTPVDGMALDRIFAMAYTSLFEGFSRGTLGRGDAEALLASWALGSLETFGERAAIAVGVVGTGALGDERTYREPAELARDVAIARAAGCRHLALFNLGGVLARPDPRAWLAALDAPQPITLAPPRARVRALIRALAGFGRAFDLMIPARRAGADASTSPQRR
jgi:hypothetical protein